MSVLAVAVYIYREKIHGCSGSKKIKEQSTYAEAGQ